jgi:hypothetical protein
LKILLSFILVGTLSLGNVQPSNYTKGKAGNENIENNSSKDNLFKNGLLPLPTGEAIVMEPLPLPKDPPPSPEPMPHPQKDKKSEKEENFDEHRKQTEK